MRRNSTLARSIALGLSVLFAPAVSAILANPARSPGAAQSRPTLPGTEPLTEQGDLAALMVDGINRWLDKYTMVVRPERRRKWMEVFRQGQRAAQDFVERRRRRLRHILGVRDALREDATLELVAPVGATTELARTDAPAALKAFYVRWNAFGNVWGEAILLEPGGDPVANVIAVPDADWTPEQAVGLTAGLSPRAQFARRLAESGCRVIVPVLINRSDTFSGHPDIRYTNQPHREFVYRGAYELGRHVIGYELLKLFSLAGCLVQSDPTRPLGIAGYGEGGLLALYAAALDGRFRAALVSGYVGPRETLWQQPIYRNVWTLVRDFGDGEVLAMIAPRTVVVEASDHPSVDGPPPPRAGRIGAAPGAIRTPSDAAVRNETEFARALLNAAGMSPEAVRLVIPQSNREPGSDTALNMFLAALNKDASLAPARPAHWVLSPGRSLADPSARQKRQIEQMTEHTHWAWWHSQRVRERFWRRADKSSLKRWEETTEPYRRYFHKEVIGQLPPSDTPLHPRTRLWREEPKWRAYEVMLDVNDEVFAYGIVLIPRDIKPGERRPVVVCQHGLEGRPQHTINRSGDGFGPYQAFAARLADRGYVVYAPQNPYIGRDRFRTINRRGNPLGLSLFSFIVEQHRRTVDWLRSLPFVDPERIGFYGLSYGGKTAMRVPAILKDRYALSICSADFNEWIWKNTSYTDRYSYVFTIEYEMFEFDLGNTFNYAEMAALIAPRPFMVERGHRDGVAPDEWVAYEYARVRRLYAELKIPDRTEIEFFDGPHQIHGVGTFRFLDRHLRRRPTNNSP